MANNRKHFSLGSLLSNRKISQMRSQPARDQDSEVRYASHKWIFQTNHFCLKSNLDNSEGCTWTLLLSITPLPATKLWYSSAKLQKFFSLHKHSWGTTRSPSPVPNVIQRSVPSIVNCHGDLVSHSNLSTDLHLDRANLQPTDILHFMVQNNVFPLYPLYHWRVEATVWAQVSMGILK